MVHVGYDGVDLPTLLLFHLERRVEDNAYGKEVVDALKATLLLLHLLPDGVYGLGAPFHVELQPCLFQLVTNRANEVVDICVATCLCGVELLFYHVVGVVLHVLEREILKFRLQRVQAEFVGKGRVKIRSLFRHLTPRVGHRRVANETHHAHTVGNHDEYDAHVLGKRQQQVAEVVAANHGILVVEMLYLVEPMDDVLHGFAIFLGHFHEVVHMACPQERGYHRLAAQANLIDADACRLHGCDYRVQSEHVATNVAISDGLAQARLELGHVIARHSVAHLVEDVSAQPPYLVKLFTSKNKRLVFHFSFL